MKTTNLKSNKMLFVLLFAALSLDLAGRLQTRKNFTSSDLASEGTSVTPVSGAEKDCARSIIQSMHLSGNRNGSCTLDYDKEKATVTATITRTREAAPEDLNWIKNSAKTNLLPEPARPDLDAACPATTEKTTPAKKGQKAKTEVVQNSPEQITACKTLRERDYEAALKRVQEQNERASAKNLGPEVLSVKVQTELADCADCLIEKTLVMPLSSTPLEISRAVLAEGKIQVKKIMEQKVALEEKLKKEAEAKAAAERLAKDKENCLRGDDGKALGANARLICDKDKLAGAEGAEAKTRFARIRTQLDQLLLSSNSEDRSGALAISEEIYNNGELPRDVRETARVMHVGGKYNSQIIALSTALAQAPANSPTRLFHMQKLVGLQQQMQYELGSAANTLNQTGGAQSMAAEELMNWSNILTNNYTVAITNPSALAGAAGGTLGLDINQQTRVIRGANGELITTQNGFNALTSGNTAVNNALTNQQNLVNGLLRVPGIPGQVFTSQTNQAITANPAAWARQQQVVPNAAANNVSPVMINNAVRSSRAVN